MYHVICPKKTKLSNTFFFFFIPYISYLSNTVSFFVAHINVKNVGFFQIIKMEYDISSVFVLVLLQTQVIIIVHYTYLYSNKHLSHDTILRSFRLHIANIYITSLRQLLTSQNRYCQEAVNSVESVTSCPTSKTEWDIAALRKNCSRIASRQNCINVTEKFQYHCVINGLRNKLVEVCAPTRIIFGTFYFL